MDKHSRLFELLWIVLALSVIAGIIFVAFVRPRQRTEGMRAQHDSNIGAIERALDQARDDAGGDMLAVLGGVVVSSVPTMIGSGVGEVNLCRVLVPSYLVAMPFDFSDEAIADGARYKSCDDYRTGYTISRDALGVVKIDEAF